MSISRSTMAYKDCYETMDRAVASNIGIRMAMPDRDKAYYFRMRCHNARAIRRDENAKIYERGHPLHGTCEYDTLQLRIRQVSGAWYIYFDKNEVIPGPIEDLEQVQDQTEMEIEYNEVYKIEGPKDDFAPEVKQITQSILKRRL